MVVQLDVFYSKLPGFYQFFTPSNALLLAATLGVAKVFHEFGHGLTCKHFKGECHEMGVMILVLTPCLYCNVSDSWMLPSKWQRAAIGAAGMFVEVVLASICTFVWWFTEPGLLNNLCLNIMFIASVTTLDLQREPAAAVRRLLHPGGHYGNPEPPAESHPDSQPKGGGVVPRNRAAGRPVPPATESDLLRLLFNRRRLLPLVRHGVDFVFPLPAYSNRTAWRSSAMRSSPCPSSA